MRSQVHHHTWRLGAVSILVMAMFVIGQTVSGQAPAQSTPTSGDRPAFDVISVKRNKLPNARAQIRLLPDGRFTATGVLLRDVIRSAYRLWSPGLIVDAPRWLSTDRFDIEAIGSVSESTRGSEIVFDGNAPAPAPTGAQELGSRGVAAEANVRYPRLTAMVQTLLEDRFKLKAHMATRELPIYNLELARTDKRLGSNMRLSTADCTKAPAPGEMPCGISGTAGKTMGRGSTMFDLALRLANFPNISPRLVFDRTGLTERYDWSLEWTPQFINAPNGAGGIVPNPNADSGVSIFGALQEQLGLRLRGSIGPVDVLVIDSVEPPTEN